MVSRVASDIWGPGETEVLVLQLGMYHVAGPGVQRLL